MEHIHQDLSDSAFVQDPYPFYDRARALGDIVYWPDFGMPCAVSHTAIQSILRDRRFGREPLEPIAIAPHTTDFYAVEAHSMLELEPPKHRRLRGLVLRAFTSRRISELAPEISVLADELAAALPPECDLLDAFARALPVRIIARLLGVPEAMSPELLSWSNAMVAMYQVGRTYDIEVAANTAAKEFTDFLRSYVDDRRTRPADDLITHLIAAEEDGDRLSTDELITTCILLLNAGHEATVHTIGNGVAALLGHNHTQITDAVIEEILRFDPPLHIFTRWVYEDLKVFDHALPKGSQIACILGAGGRDPSVYPDPGRFDPHRYDDPKTPPHPAFGAGLHFCVGAPLARLELKIGLERLFHHHPNMRLTAPPRYGDTYHFHGLEQLMVTTS